jgi:hypothetical protein
MEELDFEVEGIDLVVNQWMVKNRDQRKKKIMRQGIDPVLFGIVENIEFVVGEGIIRELRLSKVWQRW